MSSPFHGELSTDQGVHIPFQYTFPDEASRTGAPASRLEGGASKLALQLDTFELWLLSSVSPTPTWTSATSVSSDGGGGGTNEGINLGTGFGVFHEVAGGSFQFKSLVQGGGVNLTSGTSTVTITASETANASGNNIGTGIPVFRDATGTRLDFRTLLPGDGVNVSSATSTVTITASAGGGGNNTASGTNLGSGIFIYRETTAGSMQLKGFAAGASLTATSTASTITLAASVPEEHFSFTVGSAASGWNNDLVPIWQAPRGASVSIKQITAMASGLNGTDTLDFNLQKRDWQAIQTDSAAQDIFGVDQTANASGILTTLTPACTIDPLGHVVLSTGNAAESGSVKLLHGTVYYVEV